MMEKSASRTIRLGVFVTLGVILFTAAVYLIGQKQNLFSKTFKLNVEFNNVNGLQPGNNVRFSGINIGSVTQVEIINDTLILVEMRIKESVRPFIKKDALASIGTDGLMGNMLVNISPGKSSSSPVKDGDLLEAYSRIKTDDMLSTLNVTNQNAALLTFHLLEIVQQIKKGGGTISTLLYDTTLSNEVIHAVISLRNSFDRAELIMKDLNKFSSQLNDGNGTIEWLLNDTITQYQVENTLTAFQKTGEQLQSAADSLKFLISEIRNGKGTVHVLVNDTTLASDLKTSLHNIKTGTDKFDENMEALKRNFLFKKYFKEKEKEAKKSKQ